MEKDHGADLISLGTMIRGNEKIFTALDRFLPLGIESVQIFFWDILPEQMDGAWMETVVRACRNGGVNLSSLALFANPLRDDASRDRAAADWLRIIGWAAEFGIPVVSGFTGRKPGKPVSDSFEAVREFFSPLLEKCLARDLRLAFENCPMEGDDTAGDWNIAFAPEHWRILFDDLLPSLSAGLEFDPAHAVRLEQPVLALAEEWAPRIFHVHGKDAAGPGAPEFCFPGEGATAWEDLLEVLRCRGYTGTVDLEGYHGPFESHQREVERQRASLAYLDRCRRGIGGF
jgi:sugar phosphate isomerase/epimerase